MASYAEVIGYIFMYAGGVCLLLVALYGLLSAVLSIPLFKPKVLKIIRLGSKEWLRQRKEGS